MVIGIVNTSGYYPGQVFSSKFFFITSSSLIHMRIEDAGSFSPSGDLLAFGVALILTLSLVAYLVPHNESRKETYQVDTCFKILMKSEVLDPDRDGLIGPFENNLPRFPSNHLEIDFPIIVHLNSSNLSLSFIMDGNEVLPDIHAYQSVSPLHSTVILFEGPEPGKITIGAVEDIK
jgi:hypothetical protein